ncbi:hypothetical protein [Streptomyces sp. AP-93]|nr:hypothetical protein [Streptomyces sp. AP-93]
MYADNCPGTTNQSHQAASLVLAQDGLAPRASESDIASTLAP